ncbi:hypothetical protein SCLCIDRAFT_14246 [Scleroderma citrinum Foug A]|uniref:Phospholipid/glycerol acyltransferase domain-containing protein n=1 Tax=Scleroderma citrinum Foug A TaxID=1036808 RepID=A0A0C3E2X6_9AGAM|nr:hypothetical protein SCLCIDRAFT_14246 [Scleroderma citrinum Foug A]
MDGHHSLPIHARPPRTWRQWLNGALFYLSFITGFTVIHAFQLLFLLPLKLIPGRWAGVTYDHGIRYTKGSFAILLNLMNQWFAPTTFSITFETHGRGKFSPEEIQQIVERDPSGKVVALHLPSKSVIISNHQAYCDWWYVWCLTYFMKAHRDVFITLKKSLKWIPILGPGMQMFRFIFLARSWASDQAQLDKKLPKLGQKAEQEDDPFAFVLFPEGTLVSRETRPISRRYAEKIGVPDLNNLLLPRSTGLHYCLRSLAPRLPMLKLLDITITYPGVPPRRYGQSYYTLRSIFCDRVPPPVIHMHLRIFDVAKQVPIEGAIIANGSFDPNVVGSSASEGDKANFDVWLRELWTCKDRFMTEFLEGDESKVSRSEPIEIPLELRSPTETLAAYCFFAPVIAPYVLEKLAKLFLSDFS